jgi:glucans biosynthesis protein C
METNDPIKNRRSATSHSRTPLPDIAKPHVPIRKHGYDNLRTFLTALVILHHTAIVYGGDGKGWEVRSQCFPPESAILITFNAINQSFFMALFFFMSGHFTQIQISKRNPMKSTVTFTRFLRILLPAVIYTFLIPPTLIAMAWASGRGGTYGASANLWSIYYSYWTHVRGVTGPVWYLALVMTFDTITILFPWGDNNHRQQKLKNAIVREKRIWVPIA